MKLKIVVAQNVSGNGTFISHFNFSSHMFSKINFIENEVLLRNKYMCTYQIEQYPNFKCSCCYFKGKTTKF